MKLRPYLEYKDSGIEWIGQIPIEWSVDRLKRSINSCKNGIWGEEAQGDERDIPCVRVADFNRHKLNVVLNEPTIRNVTEKEQSTRILSKGNLLIEKSGGGENQPVGCVVLYEDTKPAVCSNFVARIELANGMDPSFWRYIHATAYSIRLTVGSINQTSGIQNLDQDRYFDERTCFPSFQEQIAIASFLDRETGKLDNLIAKQEHLIELLQEKRQAIISHAVTKGLNPDAKMKDSGVEWLGMVPDHWSITKLGYESWLRARLGWKGLKAEEYVEDGYVFLSTPNIKGKYIDFEQVNFITPERYEESPEIKLRIGDILLAKDGSTLGTVNVVRDLPRPATVNSSIAVITPNTSLISLYLFYMFRCSFMENTIERIKGGMGVPHLFQGDLNKFHIPLPDPKEQLKIVSFLEHETTKIDTLIDKAKRSIELAKEHRTALISAAVTGKIDVREAA